MKKRPEHTSNNPQLPQWTFQPRWTLTLEGGGGRGGQRELEREREREREREQESRLKESGECYKKKCV